MPSAEVQIFFGTVSFVILCSILVTQHFAAPETRWHVRLSVVVSLVTSASIVALVPFDVYTVRHVCPLATHPPPQPVHTLRDHGTRVHGCLQTLQHVHAPLVPIFWSIAYWYYP